MEDPVVYVWRLPVDAYAIQRFWLGERLLLLFHQEFATLRV